MPRPRPDGSSTALTEQPTRPTSPAAATSTCPVRPVPRHLAVLTCMDARIDVFAVLGLALGDAHVIRNAGARVTDDVAALAGTCPPTCSVPGPWR